MASRVRLRIELADRPGSLAEVASTIADHQGNIIAVDVLEGPDGVAVDDMTIEFADHVDLALVRRAITVRGAARVLSLQAASAADPIVRVLQRITQSLGGPAEAGEERVRSAIGELCATPAVWIVDPETAATFAVGRHACEQPGTAAVGHASEPLPRMAETISGQVCLLALSFRSISGRRVVMAARPAALGFSPTECARAESLVALFERLESRSPVES